MTTIAALLAAGAGSRFRASGGSTHKLLAPLRGRPLAAWALDAVEAALGDGLDEVVVVTGEESLHALLAGRRVRVAVNPWWEHGIATSLAEAVAQAHAGGHDALVVGLADQPGVTTAAWRAVAAADAPIAVATYGGRRANPVRLAASVWDRLPDSGDEGARALMRATPSLVREVPCPGDPFDVDVVEDLDRWS